MVSFSLPFVSSRRPFCYCHRSHHHSVSSITHSIWFCSKCCLSSESTQPSFWLCFCWLESFCSCVWKICLCEENVFLPLSEQSFTCLLVVCLLFLLPDCEKTDAISKCFRVPYTRLDTVKVPLCSESNILLSSDAMYPTIITLLSRVLLETWGHIYTV